MSVSKEQQLWEACADRNLSVVQLLSSDSAVNVNWIGPEKGDSPLHRACRFGHLQVVEILLLHSQVEVNIGNAGGGTPFYIACQEGHTDVVLLLLADLRIDINKPKNT